MNRAMSVLFPEVGEGSHRGLGEGRPHSPPHLGWSVAFPSQTGILVLVSWKKTLTHK